MFMLVREANPHPNPDGQGRVFAPWVFALPLVNEKYPPVELPDGQQATGAPCRSIIA